MGDLAKWISLLSLGQFSPVYVGHWKFCCEGWQTESIAFVIAHVYRAHVLL